MANVLVTGGAGYVGSVCCRQLLDQGYSVVVIDDLSAGCRAALPNGVGFLQCDIGDRDALSRLLQQYQFEAVFHFAAKALIPESVLNPGIFFDSNVGSGIAMLEVLRAAGLRKFVFSSSAAVYGSPSMIPIVEDHPKNPINAYGETKLIFENVLQWYAKAYHWSVVAFRYFNACGSDGVCGENHNPETHLIPLLLQTAAGDRPFFEIYGGDYETADGTCLRDFVHVSDIAQAHVRALEVLGDPGCRIYNVGTGISHSIKQICRAVESITGRKLAIKVGARRHGDPPILCASPNKIMHELNWTPNHSSIEGIIESAWKWMNSRSSQLMGEQLCEPRAVR
jgi:UDP-glucose 4-epimerase